MEDDSSDEGYAEDYRTRVDFLLVATSLARWPQIAYPRSLQGTVARFLSTSHASSIAVAAAPPYVGLRRRVLRLSSSQYCDSRRWNRTEMVPH